MHGAARSDPVAVEAEHPGELIEVSVVVQDIYCVLLRSGGYQRILEGNPVAELPAPSQLA